MFCLVLSYWLAAEPFVLSLYKCDTTRMVGRPVNSTAIYTSLQYLLNPPHTPINLHNQHLINPHTSTYTAYISLKPAYVYHMILQVDKYITTPVWKKRIMLANIHQAAVDVRDAIQRTKSVSRH